MEENNPKTQKIRIHRILQAAIKLSNGDSSGNEFIGYDGLSFLESSSSPVTNFVMPSRRNVALTSIFRSSDQSGQEATSPTTSRSGLGSPNDIFRSIWTPDGDNSGSSGFPNSDSSSTWN